MEIFTKNRELSQGKSSGNFCNYGCKKRRYRKYFYQICQSFYEEFSCDALTIAPYMGRDSVEPFLEFKNKYAILLGLTSNPGSLDFQQQKAGEEFLYEKVLKTALNWDNSQNLMFV